MKTCKFGGTSMANATQIKKAIAIIQKDPERRAIVVSAPGARNAIDTRITALLRILANQDLAKEHKNAEKQIISRYQSIIKGLGLNIPFKEWFDDALQPWTPGGRPGAHKDYLISRGEYWMARILAMALGFEFIDAISFIVFDGNGVFDLNQTKNWAKGISLEQRLAGVEGIVVPGFYGTSIRYGGVVTFPPNGSDISGAVLAVCTNSTVYENWTDKSGVLMADPRIVDNPLKIDTLTFKELRELAYMGASVLHEDAIYPARANNIPINVRNTNAPADTGTYISCKVHKRTPGQLIGIAGQKGFSVIRIEQSLMNDQVGFLRRVCQAFENYNINIEHIPGGIDTLSVIVASNEFEPVKTQLLAEINQLCEPDLLSVESKMAMICIVISDTQNTSSITARICHALSVDDINIRMVNQGASAISIIIGVDEKDYEYAIRAIYEKFK